MDSIPYTSAMDSLMYAMVYTRPKIARVVRALGKFMVNPRHEHCDEVKRIFRYL
jgi:hypothetical protein